MKRQVIDSNNAPNFRPYCPLSKFERCLCADCAVWEPLTYAEFEANRWSGSDEKVYEAGRYGRCGL